MIPYKIEIFGIMIAIICLIFSNLKEFEDRSYIYIGIGFGLGIAFKTAFSIVRSLLA